MILIDEIDKMGADFRGDPSSAMLEVLDPEQNKTFRDHYLDLPFDLSKVLFICTANTLDTIPGPLLDRMDTIAALGLHRGREARDREALPAAEAARGARPQARRSSRSRTRMLRTVIREYTREAGVRNLERRLADVCRKAATQVAKGKAQKIARRRQAAARVARAAAVLRRGRASARRSRASRPGSPTRLPAATCCSSRRRRTRARAS